jgi:hypothetical protein
VNQIVVIFCKGRSSQSELISDSLDTQRKESLLILEGVR